MTRSRVEIIVTGGTIDKVYKPNSGSLDVGDPFVADILSLVGLTDVGIRQILGKDSLEFDDNDRQLIHDAVRDAPSDRVLVTHGTDTMIATALELRGIDNKTIVLTGAMIPGNLYGSDAGFNIGFALAMVRTLPPGVHVAMHGRIFAPDRVWKNRTAGRFEETPPG